MDGKIYLNCGTCFVYQVVGNTLETRIELLFFVWFLSLKRNAVRVPQVSAVSSSLFRGASGFSGTFAQILSSSHPSILASHCGRTGELGSVPSCSHNIHVIG